LIERGNENIIQKSFNRFFASLHLKVNELVASHEPASKSVINAEEKTEHEISKLSKEYVGLAERIKKDEETTSKTMDSIRAEKQKMNYPAARSGELTLRD
jgi:low affinity Fe/Cu permease